MASTAKTAAANAPRDTQAPTDPVRALLAQGQSLWLDYITRDLVRGGGLRRLIEADGIRGETSNPTIFGKAIASDSGYDQQIKELVAQGKDAEEIFEALAVT